MVKSKSKNISTSSNASPKGPEIASLISRATSCCSVMSCIRSSILPMSLKIREDGDKKGLDCTGLSTLYMY